MNSEVEFRRCLNAAWGCNTSNEEPFCSEVCRVGSGYKCPCDHLVCNCAAPAVWENEMLPFYGGRLL